MKLNNLSIDMIFDRIFNMRGRHAVSYALDMSRAMRPITCFVSRVEWISVCISCSVLLVLLCLRKPF